MRPFGNFNLARQELKKVELRALYKLRKEMGNHLREIILKINDEVIWCTDISHTLSFEWSVGDWLQWTIRKVVAESVQNKLLKWLLGVNKYCNYNNRGRAETGRFPMNENWSPMKEL